MYRKKIVLDKGFVQLMDSMGNDLTVVNTAKISKNKKSKDLSQRDKKLIENLAKWQHWTPFSHVTVQLQIKMPIFIARQYFKSQVGFTRNELSRRSVNDEPEFYLPDILQGTEDIDYGFLCNDIAIYYERNVHLYTKLLLAGVLPEQARIVLPQAMYTTFIETGSLASYARLYKLRIKKDSQWEIQEYAKALDGILSTVAPYSWEVLKKY